MKTIIRILFFILWISPLADDAQSDGKNSKSQYYSNYNPATVTTLEGEIISVKEIEHNYGQSAGIHLELKLSSGLLLVHVGPKWYIRKQSFELKTGDKIKVTGSKVDMDNQTVLIAKEITKGSKSILLRSDNGKPLWSGQGNRKK